MKIELTTGEAALLFKILKAIYNQESNQANIPGPDAGGAADESGPDSAADGEVGREHREGIGMDGRSTSAEGEEVWNRRNKQQ